MVVLHTAPGAWVYLGFSPAVLHVCPCNQLFSCAGSTQKGQADMRQLVVGFAAGFNTRRIILAPHEHECYAAIILFRCSV